MIQTKKQEKLLKDSQISQKSDELRASMSQYPIDPGWTYCKLKHSISLDLSPDVPKKVSKMRSSHHPHKVAHSTIDINTLSKSPISVNMRDGGRDQGRSKLRPFDTAIPAIPQYSTNTKNSNSKGVVKPLEEMYK